MLDLFAGAVAVFLACQAPQDPQRYDLVVKNARLVDGVNRTVTNGDVAIRAGRIVALGAVQRTADTPVLEVGGRCIAPGFVDVHTHVDSDVVRQPLAENFLRMGVTTLITGNCGSSVKDIDGHLTRLENGGIGVNYGTLIGHGTVRTAVLGSANRAPDAAELTRMQDLVEAGMSAGAFGLSTGLIYVPGTYAQRDEITALAAVAGRHGGVYASHMRYEGDLVLEAIAETLTIGRDARLPVHISHIKCTGKPNHGRAAEVLAVLQAARAQQQVTADQYAYDASSTGIDVLFPSAELAVGREAFAKRLGSEPEYRQQIHAALLRKMDEIGFGDFRHARIAAAKGNTDLNGLLLPAAAERRLGKADRDAQAEIAIELFVAAAPARVTMVYHSMAEADVERYMAQDWIALASDSGLRSAASVDKPHPRGAGNTARLLGRYVRERGVVDLPTAVHKLSDLPATIFGIEDRGALRVGAWADLVIFDPATIIDRATYDAPTLPPDGIAYVLVNGVVAVAEGQVTGVRAGQVLRHRAAGGGR
ncbi:MAG: D-aminoacylase [Planctomycetes bacterium]|nr:D-aminoacylase [Planctomycetota bacterium]